MRTKKTAGRPFGPGAGDWNDSDDHYDGKRRDDCLRICEYR